MLSFATDKTVNLGYRNQKLLGLCLYLCVLLLGFTMVGLQFLCCAGVCMKAKNPLG